MSLSVDFLVAFGFTFLPEDINIADGETIDVPVNGGETGQLDTVQLVKRQLTLTLRGATERDVQNLEAIRANNVLGLLNRNLVTEDINIGGYIIYQAYIAKVTPSAPKIINGQFVFDQVELITNSRVYT